MEPTPVTAWVCGALFVGLRVRIPPGGMEVCLLLVLRVLSGRGLCNRPISRPEEYHGVCVCVCVCVSEYYYYTRTFSSAPVLRKVLPIPFLTLRFRLQRNDRYVRCDSTWSGWSRSLLAFAAGLLLSLSAGFRTRLSWKVVERWPWISNHHCLRAPPHSIELSLHTLSYIKQDTAILTHEISVFD
jgi:hypothetical protein